MPSTRSPSEDLKGIRLRLGITTREVADYSQRIAESENNPEFHISNAWLTQIENSDSVPSIFKLYSLSAIYRVKFTDLLLLYGVDLQKLGQDQLAAPLPETHLTNLEGYDDERTVSFPCDLTDALMWTIPTWSRVSSRSGAKFLSRSSSIWISATASMAT